MLERACPVISTWKAGATGAKKYVSVASRLVSVLLL